MFFTLSKILNFLCFPLPLALLALLFFAWMQRDKKRRRCAWLLFWVAVLGLWVCSTGPFVSLLLRPLERPFRDPQAPARVDAIVVLGGMIDLGLSDERHIELNPNADRLFAAIELARRMPHAVIIFSGGSGSLFDQAHREAPLLRAAAMRMGVPERQIVAESASRNTYENAAETKRILQERRLHSVLLVTSAYHMRRALGCFHKLGLEPIPHAVDFRSHDGPLDPMCWVPDVNNLSEASAAIKEYVGLVTYRLKGYN